MLSPETTQYSIAVALMEQRIREAEQARLARGARLAGRRESPARRWIRSLVRSRPAVPDPGGAVDPLPQAPADPWREAA